jgi:hypothetical protein
VYRAAAAGRYARVMTVILLGVVATAITMLAAQRKTVPAAEPSRDVRLLRRRGAPGS